jgi:hypothetical protein
MQFATVARNRRSQLAEAVAHDGIGRHEDAIAAFVGEISRLPGVCAVLLEVLADARAPAVARERALGRLLVAVARAESLARGTARPGDAAQPRTAPIRTTPPVPAAA